MKSIIERVLIRICKWLNVDLLVHAHIQMGAGHNTFISGEEVVINKHLSAVLKREPVLIFDIGANVGNYAAALRKRFARSTIHCFEPVPANFRALSAAMAGPGVFCHPTGFSSREEELMLFRGGNDEEGSMSTVYRDGITDLFPFIGEVEDSVNCKFSTVDEFCKTNEIVQVDFMKIDVEGHERQVLQGAAAMIAEDKILVIQYEFNEFNIVSRSFMKDFYDLLPNYDLYRVMPGGNLLPMGGYTPNLEIFRYQNIFAVHKNLNYGKA